MKRIGAAFGGVAVAGCGGGGVVAAPPPVSAATPAASPPASPVAAAPVTSPAPAPAPSPAAAAPVASTGAMQFSLAAASAASAAPFSVGFAFRRGDVPAGASVVASLANHQVVAKNRWPDASLKFAIVSGRAALAANAASTVRLSIGTAPTGAALTTADLKATGVTASIACGAFGSVDWSGAGWDAPAQTWIAGPEMASWVYRSPVGRDPHLVAWLEVRLYAGGAVEVVPWIENGYLKVAAPTSKAATFAFALGGTERFRQAIDLPSHCRTVLISGAALSHWLGADPGVSVQHDAAYLQATELVPSYRAVIASDAPAIAELPASFTPLAAGGIRYDDDSMPGPGYQRPIGLLTTQDVLYLSGTVPAAYAAAIRNGYTAGRYAIHYRDETTQRPIRFSSYPHLVMADHSGLKDIGASTFNQYTPDVTGTGATGWDPAHSPSVGFLAYLLTGRWYFMEEVQFAATAHYLWNTDSAERRNGADGLMRPVGGAVQVRASAWTLRTLFQAAVATPDDDTALRTELIASAEANINYFHASYVARPNNPFGFVDPGGDYGTVGVCMSASWMQDFLTAAFGYALAMEVPVSPAARTRLVAFFAWTARSIVGRLGAHNASDYWYINAAPYALAYAPTDTPDFAGGTGPWYRSWREIYDATAASGILAPFGSTEGQLSAEILPGANAMWGNLQPAIAYAVRHGVEGAQAAYDRMRSASNWPALVAQFNTIPVWSVQPAATR